MWKKIADSRWFYVVVSVLLAFILWLYVGNEANPTQSATLRGIKVNFSGLEKLEERGLMISEGESQTMTLSLWARRDVLNKLNSENVTVTVDVSGISEPGEYSLDSRISYPLSVNSDAIDVRDKRPEKISLTISLRGTKQVEVRGVFNGSVADGFQMGDFSFAPDVVTVSGSQELVDQVDYVLVTISQEELNETFSKDVPFTLIDFNGNALSSSGLETDVSTILVTLPVVQLKEVPLTVELQAGGGASEEDVEVTISPESIMVSGGEDDLAGLKEISLGSIDLSKIFGTDTISMPIQLSPELTNVSGVTEATVTVRIKGLSTKVLEVDNIEIINAPDGYTATNVTQSRGITIRGSEEAVAAVSASQLRIVADLKDISAATGSQTVPVKVYLDGNSEVGVVGDYNIVVSISR
ncbi:CdaR family protein [Lawsonibacter celer]|jgi:YbbR domain-containing protein|uniref:CdaR family protein n=1 Tax=Lawsonibacter celer TaxID=2986526 RepID=UPI001648D12B|nr:CdaR family protein [Lawsonibacter celer]